MASDEQRNAANVPRFDAIRRALHIGREMQAENERLRGVLAEIKANAEAWHGTASAANRHARALRVIAGWCEEALR